MRKPWAPALNLLFEHSNVTDATDDLVSVCVTVFNYAVYLPTCLDSLTAQTHRALEVIIVDDKSEKDESASVAVQWAEANYERFARLCVVAHKRNQGPSEARNTAFSLCRGDYIFILDADNLIYPRAVVRLLSAIREGGFDAAYSQLELFGDERRIGQADIWDEAEMRKENYVDVMALIRRQAWEKVEGFCHIDEGWEDYDFWLKFVDAGLKPAYVPEILCRYRVHGKSRTATEAHVAHDALKLLIAFRHPEPEKFPL
jgi:glycosyltransferase involved in cell wall biosynthesis